MKRILITTAFLMLASTPIFAKNITFSKQYSNCMNDEEQVEMQCVADEIGRQELRLNRAYQKLTAKLTPARKKELLTAQRFWRQYRDMNCGFYRDPDGGTLASGNARDCTLNETASRARELELLPELFWGDTIPGELFGD